MSDTRLAAPRGVLPEHAVLWSLYQPPVDADYIVLSTRPPHVYLRGQLRARFIKTQFRRKPPRHPHGIGSTPLLHPRIERSPYDLQGALGNARRATSGDPRTFDASPQEALRIRKARVDLVAVQALARNEEGGCFAYIEDEITGLLEQAQEIGD